LVLRKNLLFAGLLSLLVFSRQADCSEGMGISADIFLKRLGYACIRVGNGISNADIASCIQDPDGTVKILECGEKLMIVLTGSEGSKELMSVALLSFADSYGSEKKSVPAQESYENSRFVSICRQMIYSLDSGISEAEADGALKSMGIYGGNMLDGIQRSSLVKGYRCMLKLQPGGMLTMVISRI
jgi:hypothetical protein